MTTDEYPLELLHFRRLWILTPAVQMAMVVALYVSTTLLFGIAYRATGKMVWGTTPSVWILFVPISEEILFRGFILGALERAYGAISAVILSSALFGLWHLKNIFWITNEDLTEEILYTACLFGPVMAVITLKTRSVWPGVILHYMNNFPTDLIPPLHLPR